MKKLLLAILPILVVSYSYAQNTAWPSPTSNNNVGIGTTTANQKLTINGGGIGFDWNSTDKKLYSPADGDLEWVTQNGAGVHGFAVSSNGNRIVYFNTNGNSYLNGGNVGIGTNSPNNPLEVVTTSTTGGDILRLTSPVGLADNINGILFARTATDYFGRVAGVAETGGRGLSFYTNPSASTGIKEVVRISKNGYVGIGTLHPDSALTVKGGIHASSILVDQTIPTPDYVFEKDYDLTSLKDVKIYIDKNHHLPEIPSAAQVTKEGINLGEMNAKLLKKIEELTLYLIEKDKDLSNEKLKNKLQQQQLNRINKKLHLN